LTTVHWINSAGGNFKDFANWDNGYGPAAGDDAVIDAPGTYKVTLNSGEALQSLIVDDAGATLSLQKYADLYLGSSLILEAGTLRLNFGATISGGTILQEGGTFSWKGGDPERRHL
jgi:hypothetical protein